MNYMKKIIKDVSKEERIKCISLSNDWVFKLEKNNIVKYIYGYKFDLNSQATSCLLDDKYAFYSVLESYKIPCVVSEIIYNFNNKLEYAKDKNTLDYALSFFKKYNNHIVVKPALGTCGKDVYEIKSEENLNINLTNLFKKYDTLCLNPYYDIKNEYRIIVLNQKEQLVYMKIKPVVYGDGSKTINELLRDFNPSYFNNLDVSSKVLVLNKKYEYTWKFNLSKGSICSLDIDEMKKERIVSLAKKVSKILNIKFGSIDIIELNSGELLVLEANSGVMMDNFINIIPNGYEIAKDIYRKAIKEMFK